MSTKTGALERLSRRLEETLMPIALKFGKQRHLMAVRDGVVTTLPLTILGGLMLVLASPPVDPETILPTNVFNRFMLAWYQLAQQYQDELIIPFNMTMGIMVLFIVMGIAYSLSRSYKLSPFSGAVTAGVIYLMTTSTMEAAVLVRSIPDNMTDLTDLAQDVIPASLLGGEGMITAIIIGLLTVEITRFFTQRNLAIKMPEGVPPAIADSFASLIPFTVNLLLFYGIHMTLLYSFGMNLGQFILSVVTPALNAADSVFFIVLMILLGQIGWFFGIHDTATMWPIFNPLSAINLLENANSHLAGLPLEKVFTESFWSSYMAIGGSGCTMALLILLLFSRAKHLKTVGRAGLLPGIFNINEPLIFGLPIFLNPILGIPFVIVPAVNTIIAFTVTQLGLVGHAFTLPPWTTPSLLSAFLSTMDWKAAILVAVLTAIDVGIYYPFFKIYEKQLMTAEAPEETEP